MLATENPIEYEGTFPLPEAQLDRFFLRRRSATRRPTRSCAIIDEQRHGHPLEQLEPVVDVDDVARAPRRGRRTSTSTSCSSAGSSSSCARRASSTTSRSAPRSAAASRSSGPRAPGRCSTAATTSSPTTSSGSSSRCSGTALVFRPALPRARRASVGWAAALERVPRARASSSRRGPAPELRTAARPSHRLAGDDQRRSDLPARSAAPAVGLAFGDAAQRRRGHGTDVAGSRPYQPGDDVDTIDWNASARLSSARGRDEFIVRERFADEAPRVVRRLRPAPRDGALSAAAAVALEAARDAQALRCSISRARRASRALVGYLDFAEGEAVLAAAGARADDPRGSIEERLGDGERSTRRRTTSRERLEHLVA